MSAAAVEAVRRFALHGDTSANLELLHLIDHSLDVGGTNAARTVAPQLLRWSLEASQHAHGGTSAYTSTPSGTASTALYVAVLNRHYCLRVVLDHLAQPLDLRPSGLAELQQLYLTAARLSAQETTRRQLTQCVACLLIVHEDHLAERLGAWICGGAREDGLAASSSTPSSSGGAAVSFDDSRMALHVFVAAVDLLVDRRVPIGSIRRATQRRQLQEHLSIVLQSALTSAEDMPLLVRVTDTAVRFLLEAMYGEPQEVAAPFWAALPTSAVWQYSVACLSQRRTPCPAHVLDFVCNVLRCLTLMDEAAEALLMAALPAVLQPAADSAAVVDWAAMSRVIAAALEASTEAIITEQSPDSALFRLFSSAAERLVQVLQAPAAPSSAVNHVCEGVSALTQVLQPAPIPAMEPTDDPEDFQEIVDCMNASNATKRAALEQLRPFLATCETALATRLAHSNFGAAEWEAVAAYVAQRLSEKESEDYQIVHEEVELALYTTYERLSRLLGPLSVAALQAITSESSSQLLLVTASPDLTLQWLQAADPLALLPQAALLPCTVARYIVRPVGSAVSAWSADASLSVLNVLLHAIAAYNAHAVWEGTQAKGHSDDRNSMMKAVLTVSEAAVAAVAAVHEVGYDATQLRDSCALLVTLLWQSLSCHGLGARARHTAARQLTALLRRGVATLPDSAANALLSQDVYTQAILFASGGTANANLDTFDVLTHNLKCLGQLSTSASEDDKQLEEEAEAQVMDSVEPRLKQHVEKGEWSAEDVASFLSAWNTQYPSLALCYVRLVVCLPASLQPELLVDGLTRFFALPEGHDVSTANLAALLTPHVAQAIAASAAATVAFFPLLQWLLQPHPAFTVADGGRRVRVLACCGHHLSAAGHVHPSNAVETLLWCVSRWQEFVAATALSGPAVEDAVDDTDNDTNHTDGGGEDGSADGAAAAAGQTERHVLEELAVWGRCVALLPELPARAPSWLASLQVAQDDYERMEVLKNL